MKEDEETEQFDIWDYYRNWMKVFCYTEPDQKEDKEERND